MSSADPSDVVREAARLRPALLALALAQLGDKTAADDAVQETLLAAIEKGHTFRGRSSIKTWLIAILKHKVRDEIRRQSRRPVATVTLGADAELSTADFEALFNEEGRWAEAKDAWNDPATAAEQAAFLNVLEACLTRLPARTSRAFLMREWLELTPGEICTELAVTPGNLRVLLWRARMQLRLCLELSWERD
jgi:RNA polymerase sigma-70 factor (ECF subfamily)